MTASILGTPPARQSRIDVPYVEPAEVAWKPLYRVGGAAALLSVGFIAVAVVVFLAWPPPATVLGHFTLLQRNWFRGLLDLDLLMMASYVVLGALYLALYAALRRANPSVMALALMLNLMGLAIYLTTNPAFAMLSLSGQYAAATTDAQRSSLLAAGEAVLANSVGTAFDVSYVMGAIAMLLVATVMLRSAIFSKATAYVGLLMGILMIVPATAGTFGLYLSLVSLVPTVIWLILVARGLFQLGRGS